jgi:membrane-bound lytic murein transglycosylase B
VAGRITAIRFYKASGWQQVNLTTPVEITANTIYVASYRATKGRYSADGNYFAQAHVSGVLTAPASTNGVYFYGTTSKFPTSSFNASNYYVDVVFVSP